MKTTTELSSSRTGTEPRLADLTPACARFVDGEGDGLLSVFVPHATAGLVIVELGAGSDVDLLDALDRLLPARRPLGPPARLARPRRRSVLPLLAGPSLTFLSSRVSLALGTWQSIALLDPNRDNPTRTVRLSFLPG